MWTVYELECFLFHVQWTSSCDHAATSSAVLHRISLTSGWCLSFSSSTEFFLVVNRDRYPQLRYFSVWVSGVAVYGQGGRCTWGRGCSMEACGRISHIFFVLLALFAWTLDVISSSSLFLAATCPRALRTSTETFGRISSVYLVKSGPPTTFCRVTLGNLELFLRAVSGSHRVRQSTLLLEEFHIFSSCWLSRLPCAVRT